MRKIAKSRKPGVNEAKMLERAAKFSKNRLNSRYRLINSKRWHN
jgi:hypothetical protein